MSLIGSFLAWCRAAAAGVSASLAAPSAATGSPAFGPTNASAVADLARLHQFSEPAFQARLAELYARVRDAWLQGRLGDLESSVTVDLLAAWTAEVNTGSPPMLLSADGVRATIVEAGGEGAYERVTVSLDGGERAGVQMLQYWTLERGTGGASTVQACPDCGAPLRLDDRGRCTMCRSTIDIGRRAWVLARVESARDWGSRQLTPRQSTLEALAAIGAADPTFHPDVFADRVLALHPHLALAIRDPHSHLAEIAISPNLLGRLRSAAVVVPERREVVPVTGASISYAVHWRGGDSVTVDLTRPELSHPVDRWTFFRPAGERGSRLDGVFAERCDACGAPIDIDDEGRCGHCGKAVALAAHDWLLAGVEAWPTRSGWRSPSPPPLSSFDVSISLGGGDVERKRSRFEEREMAEGGVFAVMDIPGWSHEPGDTPTDVVMRPAAPADPRTSIVMGVTHFEEGLPAPALDHARALRTRDLARPDASPLGEIERTDVGGAEAARYSVSDGHGAVVHAVVCVRGPLVITTRLTAPDAAFEALRGGPLRQLLASWRWGSMDMFAEAE